MKFNKLAIDECNQFSRRLADWALNANLSIKEYSSTIELALVYSNIADHSVYDLIVASASIPHNYLVSPSNRKAMDSAMCAIANEVIEALTTKEN